MLISHACLDQSGGGIIRYLFASVRFSEMDCGRLCFSVSNSFYQQLNERLHDGLCEFRLKFDSSSPPKFSSCPSRFYLIPILKCRLRQSFRSHCRVLWWIIWCLFMGLFLKWNLTRPFMFQCLASFFNCFSLSQAENPEIPSSIIYLPAARTHSECMRSIYDFFNTPLRMLSAQLRGQR